MNFDYDYVNDEGDKIKRSSVEKDSGETHRSEINVSALFEHTGRRTTGNIDILVYEGLYDPEGVDNPAIPTNIEAARQARRRIERGREGGDSQ